MRRRLSAVGSAISLLLCLATISLWVRSHWRDDFLCFTRDEGPTEISYCLDSAHGSVGFYKMTDPVTRRPSVDEDRGWSFFSSPAVKPRYRNIWERMGFKFGRKGSVNAGGMIQGCMVPHALPVIILAALSLPALRRLFRRDSAPHPRCQSCDYDLTGNVSGVCPECGTPVAGKAGAKA